MPLEKEILPFIDWLLPSVDRYGAIITFVVAVAGLIVISVFLAYLRMAFLLGPGEGFYAVAKAIVNAVAVDLPNLSLRRVLAIARLAVQEALRRRVLVAFVIFAIVLAFAGLFLDVESDHPARLYLSFVLTASERLILILAVLLSTFSLPNDIKSRTIHTVITKPVRASEIVLGRIVGFCLVGTALLAAMCLVNYVFVRRGLGHGHTIEAQDMEPVAAAAGQSGGWQGETSRDAYHRHDVRVGPDGVGRTDTKMEHYHEVRRVGEGDAATFEVGPPRGALVARVPIYGKLRFMDRSGQPGEGISVGKEWTYRKYIEGGSLAAAVWTYEGIRPERFPDHIPLEMNISVFRTYKGDIVSGITGTITVKNPTTGLESEPMTFVAKEFVTYTHSIPRKLRAVNPDGTLRDADLFQELVDENGRVEIWVRCSEPAQYFGMGQADVYIRSGDAPFAWNFIKGHVGIWLQMVIITCFGVMLSTFLSGPVAMFATFVVYIVGLFKAFIISVATGEQPGGGPVESFLRIITQKNMMIELDMGPVVDTTVKVIDRVLMYLMWLAAKIIPDFTGFNTSKFVAYGFNIDGNLVAEHCVVAAAFVLVLSIYGYFLLKSREIAA